MACYPSVVFLYCFCGLVGVWAQPAETEKPDREVPEDCREETYLCTRMYSVHQPTKTCIHTTCIYGLRRIYRINNELCVRTMCPEEELLKAELCREKSGWPKRLQRSTKENDDFLLKPEHGQPLTNTEA